MKALLVLAICVAAAYAVVVEDDEWERFKSTHKKTYASDIEETMRRKIYKENKKMIEVHNARFSRGEVLYERELNKFADMLSHEVAEKLNGYKGRTVTAGKSVFTSTMREGRPSSHASTGASVSSSLDWRRAGRVTPVKDQGQCQSCWAFSTTGSLEGQLFRKTGKLVSLSEMNLIQCSSKNDGCNGGLMDLAFEYIQQNGGIDTEASYGYSEMAKLFGIALPWCSYKASHSAGTVTGYVDVAKGDEEALKEAIGNIGPISVAIDANHNEFMSYKSGIYYNENCSSTKLDHGVLVVGYGTENGQDYWIVKNSWNTNWGEEGYVRMARNRNNNCGIATQASYPTV